MTNVRAAATGPGTVELRYDLASPQAGLAFDVSIEASEDGGASFPIKLTSVTGDTGPGIIPGTGKRVVWTAARDVERAAFDKFQYRITATAIPPATLPRAGGETSKPATAEPSSGGGGGMKWVLIGGGVAAAGAAAALAGGSSTPPVVPPAIGDATVSGVTDVLLATANAVTFVVTASNPQGETLTATWAFGDGSSGTAAIANGSASVRKTYTTAGSFVPRVTVTGSRGGSSTRDYRTITVATLNGRWTGRFTTIGGNFSLNLTQNGTQITGDGLDDFTSPGSRSSSVSGSVSGPPSALRFRLTYPEGGFYEVDVTGSADQRTFTGTITGRTANPFAMVRQ